MNLGDPISVLKTFHEHQLDIAADGCLPAPLTNADYIKDVLVDGNGVNAKVAEVIGKCVADLAYKYADENGLYKIVEKEGVISIWKDQRRIKVVALTGDETTDEFIIAGINAFYRKGIWL